MLVCSLDSPLGSLALFEMDHWDRVSLSGEGALSVVLVEYSWRLEREPALFGRLAEWIVCFCCGIPALNVSRHALGRMTESCPMLISAEFAVIIPEWFVCVEDETSDASCQILSSIGVESLVDVRDSPIPMGVVSAVSLESCPAGRSEV